MSDYQSISPLALPWGTLKIMLHYTIYMVEGNFLFLIIGVEGISIFCFKILGVVVVVIEVEIKLRSKLLDPKALIASMFT